MKVAVTFIDSSLISAFAYDSISETLVVTLYCGAQYSYANVPLWVSSAFLSAGSFGEFYNKQIKGKYTSTKLGSRQKSFNFNDEGRQ